MICVSAMFLANPGQEAEVNKLLKHHVKRVSKEHGILASRAYRSLTEPRRFFVYHEMQDRATQDAHRMTRNYGKEILTEVYGLTDPDSYVVDFYAPLA